MNLEKFARIIWMFMLGTFSIFLLLLTYFGSGTQNIPLVLLVLSVLWLPLLIKNEGLKIVWRWLKIEKKMNLNRVFLCIFITLLTLKFTSGFLYHEFYSEKIETRKQHLFETVQMLPSPPNAEKISEEHFSRSFAQTYSVKYHYGVEDEEIRQHYITQVKQQGYKVLTKGKKSIEAEKDGVIVSIEWRKEKVYIHTKFDDIFQRFAL